MTAVAKKRGAREATVAAGEEPITSEGSTSTNLVAVDGGEGKVEVLTADETEALKVHTRIVELLRSYESLRMETAQKLFEVLNKKLFKTAACGGHEAFEDYVEAVGMSRRDASRLTAVWEWYGVNQKANPQLLDGVKELGWAKTALLARVITTKNMGKWLKIAQESKYAELDRVIRAAKLAKKKRLEAKDAKSLPPMNPPAGMNPDVPEGMAPAPAPTPEPTAAPPAAPEPAKAPAPVPETATGATVEMHEDDDGGVPTPTEQEVEEFMATNEEHKKLDFMIPTSTVQIVEDALKMAKEIGHTTKRGYPLVLICQHFLTFNSDKKTIVIGEWLARFERMTGLKLIAIDEGADDVIYGREYLRTMAAQGEKGN